MTDEREMSEDNPLSILPKGALDIKVESLSRMDALRMSALAMAVKHHGELVIKDAAMYQAKKLEGANFQLLTDSSILQTAINFERYLRGDYAEMADLIVDGDFNAWLKEQVDAAAKQFAKEATP
jgi:hypothetical protein